MGFIKDIQEYKERRWFKRRKYGWGWTPVSLQGWIITILYILFIAFSLTFIDLNNPTEDGIITFSLMALLSTLTFFAICYYTGEPPRWQWGDDDHIEHGHR